MHLQNAYQDHGNSWPCAQLFQSQFYLKQNGLDHQSSSLNSESVIINKYKQSGSDIGGLRGGRETFLPAHWIGNLFLP